MCATSENKKEEKELFFFVDVPGSQHPLFLSVCPSRNISNIHLKTIWFSYPKTKRAESSKCYVADVDVKHIIHSGVG